MFIFYRCRRNTAVEMSNSLRCSLCCNHRRNPWEFKITEGECFTVIPGVNVSPGVWLSTSGSVRRAQRRCRLPSQQQQQRSGRTCEHQSESSAKNSSVISYPNEDVPSLSSQFLIRLQRTALVF